MSAQSFTVSELNKFVRDVIASGFPTAVWVCGEIQGLRVDQKGHTYFELCEQEEGSGGVKAKMKASIWNTRRMYIDSVLKKVENGFSLKDDIEVKFLCRVDFWQKGGTLSLSVEGVDPTYTLGKIAQERQKLIALLKKDGILDKNKARVLPLVPLNIGLVTSFDSAAYNDFMDELKQSGFAFEVHLANAIMQGKTAEASVATALKLLNKTEELDLIVITRGGGSIAELSCFDSELIARTIASLRYPVLTGIGHEINTTITDLAAHTYAKTPTASAQFIVGRVKDYLTLLDEKKKYLVESVLERIAAQKNILKLNAMTLQSSTIQFLRLHREQVLVLTDSIKRTPLRQIKTTQKVLLERQGQFLKTIPLNLNKSLTRMNHYQKVIDIASPHNTLKRGFSITRDSQGRAVKSLKELNQKDQVSTQLADGSFQSIVV